MDFIAIKPTLKSGEERFSDGERQLPYQLIDFWRWNVSDLLSNTMRGILAEFIVKIARGCKYDTPSSYYELKTFISLVYLPPNS